MKKLFISQPMADRTDESIAEERKHLIKVTEEALHEEVEVIDSLIKEKPPEGVNKSVWYLGKSIELMSQADVIIFARDWENYRGCKIEYEVAEKYGFQNIILSYSDVK